MNYDSNAFLAGLAVGRRLKGWAGSGSLSMGGGTGGGMEVIPVTSLTISFSAILIDTPLVVPADSFSAEE